MGASDSTLYVPALDAAIPPRRIEPDYPTVDPIGIGKGMAQGCQWGGAKCQLVVPQGVSASAAKLYRDQGTIRRDVCKRFARDLEAVSKNQKAFEEVKKDLIAGAYYEELPGSQEPGYCRQILYNDIDLKGVLTPDKLPLDKVRYPVIRKISDTGGYSAVTKLFIKPTIPFEIEFNGKPHKITILTLMHPSPIRVENVQHDAMMTLGDPGIGNNDGLVIMVPLVGSLFAGPSGDFINKVVRYMTGVLQPDPATGQYESIDIPTGNDWDVSKLFPGTPGEGGKTYVTEVGYYVWSGQVPLTLQPEGSPQPQPMIQWFKNIWLRQAPLQQYAWRPAPNVAPIEYVMLSKPALVSSMDLQTIRMLPMTPPTEAVAQVTKFTLSYRTADSCPAPKPGSFDLTKMFGREKYENPLSSVKLPDFRAPDIDKCDPFASLPSEPPGKEQMITAIVWFLTTFGVLLAIYFAVLIFTKYKAGQWIADKMTGFGNWAAQMSVDKSKRIPKDTLFEVTAAEEEAERKKDETRRQAEDAAASSGAEARLSAIPGADTDNPLAAKAKKKPTDEARRRAEDEAASSGAEERLSAIPGADTVNPLAVKAKKKADDEAIEKARLEAEAEADAKKKADDEAIEKARLEAEAEADAKRKAEEEAAAKRKAEEEAAAKRKAEEEAAAGTGLLTADDRFRQEAQAEVDRRAAEVEAQREKTEEMRKRVEEREAKEAEEARIKAAAEEAAASASKAAETQTKRLKRRKVESSDRALPTDAAVPPPSAAAPPPGHPPPTGEQVSSAQDAAAALAKETKGAATIAPKRSVGPKLAESDVTAKRAELDALRSKVFDSVAALKRGSGLRTAQWKGRTTWTRYEDERKFQTQLKPTIATFLRFKTAVETSGLDALARAGYETAVRDSGKDIEGLVKDSRERIEHLEQEAAPARIVKGGRRNRKRKSTRRYVA